MRGACGVLVSILVGCGGPAAGPPAPIANVAPVLADPPGPQLTLVVVANGQEIWMGNDDIEPAVDTNDAPNPAYYPGFLKVWQAALDVVPLHELGDAHSRGAYLTYADATTVARPLGPLATFDGAAFGTQRDYYTKLGSNLVQGIEAGIALFDDGPGEHVLLILGDGNDTNNAEAVAQLAELKKRAARAAIDVYAIRWIGPLSDPDPIVTKLVPASRLYTVSDASQIASALRAIRDELRAPSR